VNQKVDSGWSREFHDGKVHNLKQELQLLNQRFESNMELIKSLQNSEEKKKVSITTPNKTLNDEGKQSSNNNSPAIKLENNASGSQFPLRQTEQRKERYQNMKKYAHGMTLKTFNRLVKLPVYKTATNDNGKDIIEMSIRGVTLHLDT